MDEFEQYKILLNSRPDGGQLYQTITLSHSLFSKTYYLVVDTAPLIAKDNQGVERTFEPASIKPVNAVNSNDLSQDASFTIGDVQNILDEELDNIPLGDSEDIIIAYSIYTKGNLEAPAEYTEYEAKTVSQQKGVFTAKVGAPDLNKDQTGEVFDFDTYPMLRSI